MGMLIKSAIPKVKARTGGNVINHLGTRSRLEKRKDLKGGRKKQIRYLAHACDHLEVNSHGAVL